MKKRSRLSLNSLVMTPLYFLAQFFLTHLLYFGFKFSPTLGDYFRAFNIGGILLLWRHFFDYIATIWGVKYILLIVFMAIPYLLAMLWEFRHIAIYAVVVFQLFKCACSMLSFFFYSKKIDISKCVIVKVGMPGTGKSASGLWQAVTVARRQWRELKYRYFTMYWKILRLKKRGLELSLRLLNDFKEVKTAFDFYTAQNCVPCLWTNIPVVVGGKFSNALTRAHFEQVKRLPAYSVLFFDEIGSSFLVDEGRSKSLDVSDFFRLCRHFGEFRIICTEQDRSNIYIDIRRVVADNEQMLGQSWVLRPILLVFLFNLLKSIFLLKPRSLLFLAPLILFLFSISRSIGFRKFRAVSTGNSEAVYSEKQKKRIYFLPATLNCTYDDRTFRDCYKCRGKIVVSDIFVSLTLPLELYVQRPY